MDAKTYNILKKVFPLAFKLSESVGQLILGLVIHLVGGPIVSFVVGLVLGITVILLPVAPVVGTVISVYTLAAAVIEILVFAKVIKAPEAAEVVSEEATEEKVEE